MAIGADWQSPVHQQRYSGVKDFLLEVAKGNVEGHDRLHKFGRNPDIDTGGAEAIWNGGASYTGFDATAGEALEALSSNAADAGTEVSSGTATGGSETTLVDSAADFVTDGVAVGDIVLNDTQGRHGIVTVVAATTLTVHYMSEGSENASGDAYRVATPASTGAAVLRCVKQLNSSYAEQTSVYIILNGVTGVSSSLSDYLRCSRARVVLAGSGGESAGQLTIRQATTTANVFAVLPAGYNGTMIAAWTVPAGQRVMVLDWYVGTNGIGANADINGRLKMRAPGEVFVVQEERGVRAAGTSDVTRHYRAPKGPYYGKTDIVVEADVDTNNTPVVAGFDLLIYEA